VLNVQAFLNITTFQIVYNDVRFEAMCLPDDKGNTVHRNVGKSVKGGTV